MRAVMGYGKVRAHRCPQQIVNSNFRWQEMGKSQLQRNRISFNAPSAARNSANINLGIFPACGSPGHLTPLGDCGCCGWWLVQSHGTVSDDAMQQPAWNCESNCNFVACFLGVVCQHNSSQVLWPQLLGRITCFFCIGSNVFFFRMPQRLRISLPSMLCFRDVLLRWSLACRHQFDLNHLHIVRQTLKQFMPLETKEMVYRPRGLDRNDVNAGWWKPHYRGWPMIWGLLKENSISRVW